MVLALTHDLHESATGDILPGLKNPQLRQALESVQQQFLKSLMIEEQDDLKVDLKILDILAFMYEIQQAQTLNLDQKQRLEDFFQKQKAGLIQFCESHGVATMETFFSELGVFNQ